MVWRELAIEYPGEGVLIGQAHCFIGDKRHFGCRVLRWIEKLVTGDIRRRMTSIAGEILI